MKNDFHLKQKSQINSGQLLIYDGVWYNIHYFWYHILILFKNTQSKFLGTHTWGVHEPVWSTCI